MMIYLRFAFLPLLSDLKIGIALLVLTAMLLLVSIVFFIINTSSKNEKSKNKKIATGALIAAGISLIVGLGQCGQI